MAERALAHVEIINNIEPIPNADKIVVASVLGWKVVISKADNFRIGDKIIYIEIDSKVPEKPEFEFLRDRKFKVKTIKLRGQISQGLIIPLSILGRDAEIGEDVTKDLGIYYYDPADQVRKAPSVDKYRAMAQRHVKIFKNPIIRWIYKFSYGKKLLFIFFGKKKQQNWPVWVEKTDESRVQNMPWILNDKSPWIATEKIDGTSTTFTMKCGKWGKNEFYVCSRNVVFTKPDQPCFYDSNVYLEMAKKYNVEEFLTAFLKARPDVQWVTLQGETYGPGIQKRDYHAPEHMFMGFNFITDVDGRWNSLDAADYCIKNEIPWVPILNEHFILPDTVDELLTIATGESVCDHDLREGIVFRSQDGTKSFKAVSNEFLMKYHN